MSQPKNTKLPANQIYLTSLEGNRQWLDGGAMFGNVPRTMWEKWIPPDQQGRIQLACRSLLIETNNIKILCEVGIGNFFEPKLASRFGLENSSENILIQSLNNINIDCDEIDFVILSHLHFDHAGGLLPSYTDLASGKETLAFPKAKYIVSKTAFSRACNPHFRDRASFIPKLQELLIASERLIQVEGGTLPDFFEENIHFRFSEGHTPGQMLTLVHGQNESLIFTGDLVPGTDWIHLPITMGYDRFPEQVINEKNDLYNLAVPKQWLCFYTHDNKFASSYITQDEKGRYIPLKPSISLSKYQI